MATDHLGCQRHSRRQWWQIRATDAHIDPDTAAYVAEYFKTQPQDWETWYAQRIGGTVSALMNSVPPRRPPGMLTRLRQPIWTPSVGPS